MKFNENGLSLIKKFEGCKLTAYKDIVGIWTIGYGCTGDDVVEGLEITQEEAEQRLQDKLDNEFIPHVEGMLELKLNDNQFSALVSFAYNLGCAALGRSTLMKKINDADADGAADEFTKWCMAGGKVVQGLLRRRQAERDLFLQP